MKDADEIQNSLQREIVRTDRIDVQKSYTRSQVELAAQQLQVKYCSLCITYTLSLLVSQCDVGAVKKYAATI